MLQVFCVFKVAYENEQSLWKMFDSREKAESWITNHGTWGNFVIEEWKAE